MFETILENGLKSSMANVMICVGVALILGLAVSLVYTFTEEHHTANMAVTMVVLPPVVTAIISVVNGNLGTGIAILGVFALVRFRSKPGNSKDILYVLFDMAVGVIAASGYIFYTVLIVLIIAGVLILLKHFRFGESPARLKRLRVTIPEDLDYETAFDDIFEKYLDKWRLEQVKTTNLGSLFEIQYEVTLKKDMHEKEFLDEIRVRNGNLTVMLARANTVPDEL